MIPKSIQFIVLLAAPVWLFAQKTDTLTAQIQLKTSVESTTVPLNREVVYHIELSWLGELDRYRIVDVGEPAVSNLDLQSSGSANKIYNAPDGSPRSLKKISYYFKPSGLGMAYIDGVSVQYEDTRTGRKGTLMAQRLSVKITDPVSTPGESELAKYVIMGLGILFLALVVFFVFRYFQRRKKAERELPAKRTLEEKYLDKLRRDIDPSAGPLGDNVIRLSKLLNGYLSEKLKTDAALPQDTLSKKLEEAGVRGEIAEKLLAFNEKAELNKFAGEEMSPADFHLFYDTVEQLLGEMNIETETEPGAG